MDDIDPESTDSSDKNTKKKRVLEDKGLLCFPVNIS